MGNYLNPPGDGFELILNGGFYVDKTDAIAVIDAVMDTPQRFLCATRPRRFGKTFAAQMLAAFYSKGSDARRLFEPLHIFRQPAASSCLQRCNRCNVLFLDMTRFVLNPEGTEHTIEHLQRELLQDLTEAFPCISIATANTLPAFLQAVHSAADKRFFLIIDEWDLPFREAPDNHALHQHNTYPSFKVSLMIRRQPGVSAAPTSPGFSLSASAVLRMCCPLSQNLP